MKLIDLKDFPEVNANSVEFPKEIYIAYAVCRKGCGNSEFIFDGETQVCEHCGHQLFRTEERKYVLAAHQDSNNSRIIQCKVSNEVVDLRYDDNLDEYPDIAPDSIRFPAQIYITYVVCSKECGASGFIVEGQTDVCEYCGHHMLHTYTKKYALAQDQS